MCFPRLDYAQYGVTNWAIAHAGFLGVYVMTGWGKADASAQAQLRFTSLYDQPCFLDITRGWSRYYFTSGSITLSDLTSGSAWSFGWSLADGTNNVPWNSTGLPLSASFHAPPLIASHEYELLLETASNAGDDSQFAQITMTVPEPSAFGLLLVGLGGAWTARSYRRNTPALRRNASATGK